MATRRIVVRPNGDDRSSGSDTHPYASLTKAVGVAQDGDTIDISGTYPPTVIYSASFDPKNPLSIEGLATFTAGTVHSGTALTLRECSGIRLGRGIRCHTALSGLRVHGCTDMIVDLVDIDNVGHEAIHVALRSQRVKLSRIRIDGTGRKPGTDGKHQHRVYGEGIYIGSGTVQSQPDTTSHIEIVECEITRTTNEAIEAKPNTSHITITDTWVHDCSVELKGAIKFDRSQSNVCTRLKVWDIDGLGLYGSDANAYYVRDSTVTFTDCWAWHIRKDGGLLIDSGTATIAGGATWDTRREAIRHRGGTIHGRHTLGLTPPPNFEEPSGRPWHTDPTPPPIPVPPPTPPTPPTPNPDIETRLHTLENQIATLQINYETLRTTLHIIGDTLTDT